MDGVSVACEAALPAASPTTRDAIVRDLGRQPYEPVWRAMQALTDARSEATSDELWLVEHDPVDEDSSRALMTCALRRGERAEALREYRRLARALQDELGVEPGPETAALYQQLRRG